jgi:hypothetical protein
MGIVAMTVALVFLTVGAGYLLWAFWLHFEEIDAASDSQASHPKRSALLFLTLAGLIIGALAVLLVELQLLFTPPTL